jgi:esterase/lipase superfamily enzyme
MDIAYRKEYSHHLDRDMEYKIYGHAGMPVLYIPCQDGRFYDFENFGMLDIWQPWIDSGQVMVFSIDTIDRETWSDKAGNARWRIQRYEEWIWYIVEEIVPLMQDMAWDGGSPLEDPKIMVFGCSLGATHAVNLYLRFPQIFTKLLALSGLYTADYGFDGYMDDLVYLNSPVHNLANMPKDHPYISLYNQNQGIICVGQGPWEMPQLTRDLHQLLLEKDIHIWVDYWGYDSSHDWSWWHKQTAYFLPYLLKKS